MSVFQRQRAHPMPLRCPAGHALVRFEVHDCDGQHQHRVFVCPMRRGSKRCGEVVVVPAFGPGCNDAEDAADR